MNVRLDTREITDRSSFHAAFARMMGFPPFYGANMDAWIDCMSYLRQPGAAMTSVRVGSDERLLIEISDSEAFKARLPEVFNDLVECTAFVNHVRYADEGEAPPIGLVFM